MRVILDPNVLVSAVITPGVSAGRTEEALGLQGEAAERFAWVDEAPTSSPEIWRLVDW